MIDHEKFTLPPGGADPGVAEILDRQAAEIAALHQELIRSYEKELAFFASLETRDRETRRQDGIRLKKIWWLETELRTCQGEAESLRVELETTRSRLRNLQGSALGRLQRGYWKMRRGARG